MASAKVGVAIYRLKIQRIRARSDKHQVFRVGSKFDPFTLLMHAFQRDLNKKKKQELNAQKEQRDPLQVRVTKCVSDPSTQTIDGVIEVGPYGTSESMGDADDDDSTRFKSSREAVMPPYYFRIALPNGSKRGLLIVGTRGSSGPRAAIVRYLKETLAVYSLGCQCNPLPSKQVLQAYLQKGAEPLHLRLFAEKQQGDKRQFIRDSTVDRQALPVETRVEVKLSGPSFIPRLKAMLQKLSLGGGKQTIDELVEIEGLPTFSGASALLKTVDDKTRTVNLVSPDEAAMTFDLTGNVELSKNSKSPGYGHPTYDGMKARVDELLGDLGSGAF